MEIERIDCYLQIGIVDVTSSYLQKYHYKYTQIFHCTRVFNVNI